MSRGKQTTTKTAKKQGSRNTAGKDSEAEANPIIRTEYEIWDTDSVKHCLRLLSMDEASAVKLQIVDQLIQRGKLTLITGTN